MSWAVTRTQDSLANSSLSKLRPARSGWKAWYRHLEKETVGSQLSKSTGLSKNGWCSSTAGGRRQILAELWLDSVLSPCTMPRPWLARAVGGNQGLQAILKGKYSHKWMFLLFQSQWNTCGSQGTSEPPGMVPHFLQTRCLHGEAGCTTASGSPHGTI